MEKGLVLLAFVLIVSQAIGMNLKQKRQSSDDENNLDDRYGWNRPRRPHQQWGQPSWIDWGMVERPNQNQWSNQNGQNQWDNENPWNNQNWQNQWNNQNQGQNGPNPGENGQNPGQNGQNPGQNGQNPGQNGQNQGQNGQNQGQNGPTTQTPPPNNGATTQSPQVRACISACPVTPEYNPVCGTDGTTYSNPGRLSCAQSCGLNVGLSRSSPCPTTTTAAPPRLN